jgi:hypothetical protein
MALNGCVFGEKHSKANEGLLAGRRFESLRKIDCEQLSCFDAMIDAFVHVKHVRKDV